ncbi:glycosyl hydrolase family 3 C-terminal domain-containing protein [Hysterangium stoloniferum]|nr:glycosyl hydrolase family 3 C-terminal domain-containing protein [Hysterangium stoloniferum]
MDTCNRNGATAMDSHTNPSTPHLRGCINSRNKPDIHYPTGGARIKGKLRPRPAGVAQFEFGLIVTGQGKLYIDGKLVIDNWTKQRQGQAFFGMGTLEERGVIDVKPGVSHEIVIELSSITGPRGDNPGGLPTQAGVRLGGRDVISEDKLMESAVQLAKEADVVIVVIGLNSDWESEGYDRTTLDLPGRTNELVERVAAVNKKTVIISQMGSAITMPWIDSVPALVHAWYLGNATGAAIADVIFGKVNPSGKLSLTFPRRLEDTPSYGHFGSENGKVRYGEDLFVGYKHYLHRKIATLFPFGFGLSYTSFEYSTISLSSPQRFDGASTVNLSVKVTNTSSVSGSEIVQVYTSLPTTSELTHPPRSLKAFAKVALQPRESKTVLLTLDKYAVSYWEERIQKWVAEKGVYTVYVAASSEDVKESKTLFEWTGL